MENKIKHVIKNLMCLTMVWVLFTGSAFCNETGSKEDVLQLVKKIEKRQQHLEKELKTFQKQIDTLLYPKWEYKIVIPNIIGRNIKSQPSLESLGKQGWELVLYNIEKGYIFKRRMKDE